MGTNYYLRRVRPREVHDEYRVCKTSIGWPASFQTSDWYHPERKGNPLTHDMGYHVSQLEWPDEDNGEVVPEWKSVEDIMALLASGEWQILDEEGTVYGPGKESLDVLDTLCAHGPTREYAPCDYHDAEGHRFTMVNFR